MDEDDRKMKRLLLAALAPITFADALVQCGYQPGHAPLDDPRLRDVVAVLAIMRFQYADVMLEAAGE